MNLPTTLFDVAFERVPSVEVGPLFQLAVGPAGLLVSGLNRLAWSRGDAFTSAAPVAGTHRWVVRADDFLWVGADKSVAVAEGAPVTRPSGADKHAEFASATQSAWDPARGVLVRFGGMAGGTKFSQATREWRDGTWRDVKTATKPLPRHNGALCWVPPLQGTMLIGGWSKKDGHLGDSALYDGRDWRVWTTPLPSGALPQPPTAAFFDEPSGQLVVVRGIPGRALGLWRWAGEGQWVLEGALRPFPEIEDDYAWRAPVTATAWAFDPAARGLVAANPQGGLSLARIPLGAWLDGLPAARWDLPATSATPRAEPTPAERIPRRHLVAREGGVGKFWFAALDGATWTARWGQRGRPAQSKTYTFTDLTEAARDFDKKVREKLDKGYADAPEGERAAELAGAMAYALKPTRARTGGDFLHGAVDLPDARWPTCKGCGSPMTSLGVFHAHPDRLPLGPHRALAIFQCERGCAAWDPDGGANAALLLDHALGPREVGPAGASSRPLQWIDYGPPRFEVDAAAEGIEDERSPGGSKLGGTPTWVQAPARPRCDTCRAELRLAVQLDGGETGMNFGDVGIGYAFVCAEGHQAKLLSQGS